MHLLPLPASETEFRWLSSASKLSNSDISKHTLARRSSLIQDWERQQDVYEIEALDDFHSIQSVGPTQMPRDSQRLTQSIARPLHVYGRKSTAPRNSSAPTAHRDNRPLPAFRKLLDSHEARETSLREASYSSPAQHKRKRGPTNIPDSPTTFSDSEGSSVSSHAAAIPSESSSSPFVQASTKVAPPARSAASRAEADPKGRQPLHLKSNAGLPYSAEARRPAKAGGKAKAQLRPITRKIPTTGRVIASEKPEIEHRALATVISNAKRLQSFGGSWPLKQKGHATDRLNPDEEEEDIYAGETTELIENYSFQLDSTSAPLQSEMRALNHATFTSVGREEAITLQTISEPDDMQLDMEKNEIFHESLHEGSVTDGDISHGNHLNDLTFPQAAQPADLPPSQNTLSIIKSKIDLASDLSSLILPVHSTGLTRPPSPAGSPVRNQLEEQNNGKRADQVTVVRAVDISETTEISNMIPNISITFPTSPVPSLSARGHSGQVSRSSAKMVASKGHAVIKQNADVSVDTFLSIAFRHEDVASNALQSRYVLTPGKINSVRVPASADGGPTSIKKIYVSSSQLCGGGTFHQGYLGHGRRGFWEVPLQGSSTCNDASCGVILGLSEDTASSNTHPSSILWTLPRLRHLIVRLQALNELGTFGFIAISTNARASGEDISLFVSCDSRKALALRAVIGDLACALDENGIEILEDPQKPSTVESAVRGEGQKWLCSSSSITLTWWDEIERRPIMAA